MNTRLWIVGAVTAAVTAVPVTLSSPAQAAPCVSGAEVRQQVATFVHSLRDDVPSAASRAHVRAALVQSVRTARGAKADTPEERRGLGRQISALARQLHAAEDQVARKAIVAQIHALQEQRRQDEVTEEDVAEVESDVTALRKAIIGRVDTDAERHQVSTFARNLISQLGC